jgi:hypothetical protein
MRCSKCGSDNREGRKFCANCGAPLALTCQKCGASNQPGEKFCGECGAGLADAPGPKAREATKHCYLRRWGAASSDRFVLRFGGFNRDR